VIVLEDLQHDHAVLTEILTARRTVTAVTLPVGMRLVWQIYIMILEDALKTLNSMIDYLEDKEKPASLGG
jgi:hypothetical protein